MGRIRELLSVKEYTLTRFVAGGVPIELPEYAGASQTLDFAAVVGMACGTAALRVIDHDEVVARAARAYNEKWGAP